MVSIIVSWPSARFLFIHDLFNFNVSPTSQAYTLNSDRSMRPVMLFDHFSSDDLEYQYWWIQELKNLGRGVVWALYDF